MNLKAIARQYPIDKPKPPIQMVLLAGINTGGLIALFFAAFASFRLATGNIYQAFFASLLIEVGLAAEAYALIKRPKTPYPWIGLIIAFVVSGTYNWYQASSHTASLGKELSWFTLLALAFGPLSALAFISLTLGNEIREHQRKVDLWQAERLKWAENEAVRLEEKAERERKRQERRAERLRKLTGSQDGQAETYRKKAENLPVWLPREPGNLTEFKTMIGGGEIVLPPGLTGEALTCIDVVRSDRTGRNWLNAVGYRSNGNS